MATRIGSEDNPVEMLEHLMALDFDAIEAYQAAIDRIDDEHYRLRLSEFKADHQRHVDELGPVIRQLGGTPPSGSGAKSILTQGKVFMANLGGDEAILRAMKTNEDDTNQAYEQALRKSPPEAKEILQRGREDERRHWEWIVATLEGRPEPPPPQSRQRPSAPPPR